MADIAKSLNCSVTPIRSGILRAGGCIKSKGNAQAGKSRQFTPEQCDEVVRRYQSGETQNAIARHFGCSAQPVFNVLVARGIQLRTARETQQLFRSDLMSDAQIASAVALYKSGLSVRKVAAELGVTPTQLGYKLRDLKVTRSHATAAKQADHKPAITDDQAVECWLRHQMGISLQQLGRELGVGADTVKAAIKRIKGKTRSRQEASELMRRDITGQTFGKLTAIRRTGRAVWGKQAVWEFRCECGTVTEIAMDSVVKGNTQSCGCITQGESSVGSYLRGNFHKPDCAAEFYVYGLRNYPGHIKPGIDSTGRRAISSEGEYGDKLLSIELTRFDAVLLEQAVLTETRLMAHCPDELVERKWAGSTEVRRMDADALINIAVELHEQFLELGRWEFALRFVPLTRAQVRQIEALLTEDSVSQGKPADS